MSHINIYINGSDEPYITKYLNNDSDILFDTPIQFLVKMEIIYEKNDKNYYIVTLHTNTYTINLNKNTEINYDENDERVELYGARTILHSSTNEFTKATVHIYQKTDTLNKPMYTDNIDCDKCLDQLKKCEQYSILENQRCREIENSLKDMHKYKVQNDELRKLIDSKNQDTTSNMIIIVCVIIILLLLGLCIYLQFF